jgi:hypothetical protein
MATKTHKKRKKTEPDDYFGLGFYFTCQVKTIPVPAPGNVFYFVPLVPFGGYSNLRI